MSSEPSKSVYKSNALVEASYRLTPAEQRIMLACIGQVRRDQPITDDVLYSVTAAEVAAMTSSTSHATYGELAKAALRLKRREVWIREYPNGEGSRSQTLVTNWVQSIRYIECEGRVELRFTKDMLPYLTQLTEQFTRYALADVAQMTSAHAIRLYELLCQWRGVGEREVAIGWLREAFHLGNQQYPAIKDFKRRVIEPAVEQINELSPLWVKWDQRKSGRRVSHLIFTFGEKNSQVSNKKKKRKSEAEGALFGIPKQVIDKLAKPGESYEDAAIRLLKDSQQR